MLKKKLPAVYTLNDKVMFDVSEYQLEPEIIAKAITEGPQKKVLHNLERINNRYIKPKSIYPIRTKLENLPALQVTESFKWKRGYRETIFDVINNRLGQQNKSAASLQVLLSSRPERISHDIQDFKNQVIVVDNMMRELRKNKISFAKNDKLFKNVWETYFDRLKQKFNHFQDNILEHIGPNMSFDWYIQSPTKHKQRHYGNDTVMFDDELFNESFICYEILWKDAKVPVISSEGELLQDIPCGDMVFKFNVRLSALMKELIRSYYTVYKEQDDWNDIDFDTVLQNAEISRMERCTPLGSANNDRFSQDPQVYNRRVSREVGLMSRGIMINSINTELSRNIWNDSEPDLLNHPFIGASRLGRSQDSVESYISDNYIGKHYVETSVPQHSSVSKYLFPIQMNTICWGDCHFDIWSSIINLRFPELVMTMHNWNRYTIPGANPLNNIRQLHFGMPGDYNKEYRRVSSANTNTCFSMQVKSLDPSRPMKDNYTAMLHNESVIYEEDGTYNRDLDLAKIMEILSYCDKIKCTARNEGCDKYANYAPMLNNIIKTEEDKFPFGDDIYGLLDQALDETSEVVEEIHNDLDELESIMHEIDGDELPFSEVDDVDAFHTSDEIHETLTNHNNQLSTDLTDDELRDQMRTWFTARGGNNG